MSEYKAPILTVMALHWMREKFPDAMLTTELAVAKYGQASLDVAAITEDVIFGVEVKGDGDSPTRLLRQGWVYSRAAYQMWLLPAPSLEQKCVKHHPRGWGLLNIGSDGINEKWKVYDPPLPNAPAALLDILWKKELLKLSKELGLSFKQRQPCHDIATGIAEITPLSTIRTHTCRILRARNWQEFPYDKTVYRHGDPLPEIEQPA